MMKLVLLLLLIQYCYCFDISSPLLKLKSINELSILRGKSIGDITTEKGIDAINNGLQGVQRIQLQLDRSDGRPASITIGNIANKYNILISSVLRTVLEDEEKKNIWLSILGPLEYVGFRINDMIKQDQVSILDLKILILKMKRMLLDISSNDEDPLYNNKDISSSEEMKNLSVLLARIALRYSFFYDKLNEQVSSPLGIQILCDDMLLTTDIMELILSLDFDIAYSTNLQASSIDIRKQDVCDWKVKNVKQAP